MTISYCPGERSLEAANMPSHGLVFGGTLANRWDTRNTKVLLGDEEFLLATQVCLTRLKKWDEVLVTLLKRTVKLPNVGQNTLAFALLLEP
jgi:hypothetical protein